MIMYSQNLSRAMSCVILRAHRIQKIFTQLQFHHQEYSVGPDNDDHIICTSKRWDQKYHAQRNLSWICDSSTVVPLFETYLTVLHLPQGYCQFLFYSFNMKISFG